MSVKISDLAARVKKITVRVGEEVVEVSYKPGIITQRFLNDPRPVREALCDVIMEWNLTATEQNTPVPITLEGIEIIPLEILNLIWQKIFRDVTNPHEDEEKKDSGGG